MDNEIAIREMNRLKYKMSEGITLDETLFKALNTAIFALEKQISNKPMIEMVNEKVADVICPNCKKNIFRCYYEVKGNEWNQSQKRHKYCEDCGQKLEWE